MPEETYRDARIRAAERNTSVSALVREFLAGLGRSESDLEPPESDFERRKRLQAETIVTIRRFRAGGRAA